MSTELVPLGPAAPHAELKNLRPLPLPTEVNDVLWPAESGAAIDVGPDGVDNFQPATDQPTLLRP